LSGQLPYFTCEQVAKYIISLAQKKNAFGFFRSTMTCRLLEYLGYGNFYPYDPNGSQKWTWEKHPMLNNLALSLYPLFLRYQPLNVSPSTLDFWVERFLERNLHRYSQLPLRSLLKEALNSVLELETILSGTKIIVPIIPDVKALLVKIHIAVCNHINATILPNLSLR
jgi:hypothetical protein